MALPISVTYTFATATTAIPLSQLDTNFTTVVNGINGIGNGTNTLSNVVISGGTITGLSAAIPVASGGTGLTTPGTSGNVLTSDGTAWASTAPSIITPTAVGQVPFSTNGSTYTATAKIVAATAITASGTTVDFTSIPTWVKRITVILSGVSTNGTSDMLLQIGAGSVTTSGYASGNGSADGGGYAGATSTQGFTLASRNANAATIRHGSVVLTNVTGNTWVATVAFGGSDSSLGCVGGGTLALGGALDRVRLTTAGGVNTFDAGIVNILYE